MGAEVLEVDVAPVGVVEDCVVEDVGFLGAVAFFVSGKGVC